MSEKQINKQFVLIASIACFVACIGDMLSAFILGTYYYPHYNIIMQPISTLGADVSPVSIVMSACWIFIGVLFIIFAIGFNIAFSSSEKSHKFATWLIIIYGLGEEIGSGIFPGNHIRNELTTIGIVHNIVGGIGITALIILPFVMRKIIQKFQYPKMYKYSWFVIIFGLITILLFTASKLVVPSDNIISYRGLWQRLFILNYYIYLMVISFLMICANSKRFKV
ncbi:MAG: DUF998 domain-containing protein [Bacteroidales bacterium]|jgi:hypothetical protein